jgi:trk system potassium uptake protein
MIDFRPIFLVIGLLLIALGLMMLVPATVDAILGSADWMVFAVSAGLTLFVGVTTAMSCRVRRFRMSVRQGFVMATLIWLVITLFASLPFVFSDLNMSFTDAFFEAMSGITTTGATVIIGLDSAPPGLLLWRGLLQWLGGLGIVVMAVAVLPVLGVGGMQMFRVEAFETGEKMLPRATRIAAWLTIVYVGLTALWMIMLWFAGMTGLEAAVHAMTTLATGGFSTSDGSVGHFDSAAIDVIIIAGMLVGSLPFVLYVRALQGQPGPLVTDSQVRCFLFLVAVVVLLVAVFLMTQHAYPLGSALRFAAFNVISVFTGTGYATVDYWLWGGFAGPIFFLIMFIGGCTGSTTCGMKVFRFQVLWAAADTQFKHLLRPHGVFIPYYNGRPISDDIISSVLSFFFVFILCFAVVAVGLGMFGLDFVTAVSSAATAMCNVGPALGPIAGPAGTFQSFPDGAKWLMSAAMLLGRLELFTVLMLFSPALWRA